IYFASDLWFLVTRSFGFLSSGPAETKRARTTVLLLAVGTAPAALAGFFLEDFFAGTFEDPRIAAVMLFVTAALLWGAETIRRHRV
ncbi:undecaprenyl-diphosphate phosphatase, partial [Salmonella enterica]|uniref:undecaprenyl-diphosphate phosphatase n=1 Tax=Salmonella enterica TaxID=28901 RepID=UPI0039EAE75E